MHREEVAYFDESAKLVAPRPPKTLLDTLREIENGNLEEEPLTAKALVQQWKHDTPVAWVRSLAIARRRVEADQAIHVLNHEANREKRSRGDASGIIEKIRLLEAGCADFVRKAESDEFTERFRQFWWRRVEEHARTQLPPGFDGGCPVEAMLNGMIERTDARHRAWLDSRMEHGANPGKDTSSGRATIGQEWPAAEYSAAPQQPIRTPTDILCLTPEEEKAIEQWVMDWVDSIPLNQDELVGNTMVDGYCTSEADVPAHWHQTPLFGTEAALSWAMGEWSKQSLMKKARSSVCRVIKDMKGKFRLYSPTIGSHNQRAEKLAEYRPKRQKSKQRTRTATNSNHSRKKASK
jgi:hypothetical protein